MLSKFLISIDILDESMAKAIPPKVRESNYITVQPSRAGGQNNEAMQPVAINNPHYYKIGIPRLYFNDGFLKNRRRKISKTRSGKEYPKTVVEAESSFCSSDSHLVIHFCFRTLLVMSISRYM